MNKLPAKMSSSSKPSQQALREHNEQVLKKLKPGDLVEFPRTGYSHWAVYIGNEEVVHLTGNDLGGIKGPSRLGHVKGVSGQELDKGTVLKEKFWDVVGDSEARINNSKDHRYPPRSPEKIVEAALSKLGEVGYNLFSANCEHFATWCRYGIKQIDQTNIFRKVPIGAFDASSMMSQ